MNKFIRFLEGIPGKAEPLDLQVQRNYLNCFVSYNNELFVVSEVSKILDGIFVTLTNPFETKELYNPKINLGFNVMSLFQEDEVFIFQKNTPINEILKWKFSKMELLTFNGKYFLGSQYDVGQEFKFVEFLEGLNNVSVVVKPDLFSHNEMTMLKFISKNLNKKLIIESYNDIEVLSKGNRKLKIPFCSVAEFR